MNHTLDRVRLELDRSLRARPFFARAVRGELTAPEYVDLLTQLGALLSVSGGSRAYELLTLREKDLECLRWIAAGVAAPAACPGVFLLAHSLHTRPEWAHDDLVWAACVSLCGTSWTRDAADALEPVYPSSTRLLQELGRAGPGQQQQLGLDLERRRLYSEQGTYALFELVRGALLALGTYLDTTWPARIRSWSLQTTNLRQTLETLQ